MYVQAAPHPATPARFGMEVFERRIRDPRLVPMDLPAGPEYVVGPGDGLAIHLWGGISRQLYRAVDREGRVSLPEIGPVLVSGKSLAEVQQSLQSMLRTQFRDVSADVSLSRLRTIRVYEAGDVTSPGAYDISSLSTPLAALFSAGGPTPRGSLRRVKHYRGERLVETVDLYDLLLNGVKREMARLENGDTVLVPPIGPEVTLEGMVRVFSRFDFENPPQVTVAGEVRAPGTYRTAGQIRLGDAVRLAGGLAPDAEKDDAQVFRYLPDGKLRIFSVSLGAALDGDPAENILLQPRDHLLVHASAAALEPASVYIEGQAAKPGRYPLGASMSVGDLIRAGGGLKSGADTTAADLTHYQWSNQTKLAAQHQEVPIAAALAGDTNANVALHNGDVLTIRQLAGWSDLGASIRVQGEVQHPGTYGIRPGERLSAILDRAGGLPPEPTPTARCCSARRCGSSKRRRRAK